MKCLSFAFPCRSDALRGEGRVGLRGAKGGLGLVLVGRTGWFQSTLEMRETYTIE